MKLKIMITRYRILFCLVIISLIFTAAILSPAERKFIPFGFAFLFSVCFGFSTYLYFKIGNLVIAEYSNILKKHKIEYFYLGINPRINLREVSQKLKEEPSVIPSVFLNIKNQQDFLKMAIIAFVLYPASAILLN